MGGGGYSPLGHLDPLLCTVNIGNYSSKNSLDLLTNDVD